MHEATSQVGARLNLCMHMSQPSVWCSHCIASQCEPIVSAGHYSVTADDCSVAVNLVYGWSNMCAVGRE